VQDPDDRRDSLRPLGKGVLVALAIMVILIGLGYILVTVGS
jgi:hypothetical protein